MGAVTLLSIFLNNFILSNTEEKGLWEIVSLHWALLLGFVFSFVYPWTVYRHWEKQKSNDVDEEKNADT